MARLTRYGLLLTLMLGLLLMGCGEPNDPDTPPVTPELEDPYTLLASTMTRGFPTGVAARGDSLFVAESYAGVGLYSISDRQNPERVQQLPLNDRADHVRVIPAMNLILVNARYNTFPASLSSLLPDADHLFGSSGVLDMATAVYRDTVEAGGYIGPNPLGPHESDVTRLLMADVNDGLHVYRVYVDSTMNPSDSTINVFFTGESMYTRTWDTGIPPTGVTPLEDIFTVAVGLRDFGVGILNASPEFDPENGGPWISNVDTPGEAGRGAYQDGYLYIADGAGGLAVIDARDVNNPVYLTSWKQDHVDHILDVSVLDHRMVVMDQYDGFFFFDISDPTSPEYLGEYEVREPGGVVFVEEDLVACVSVGDGLSLLRLEY